MGNETEKNQQNPSTAPVQTIRATLPIRTGRIRRRAVMSAIRRIRPRRTRVRPATLPTARTVKARKTSKSVGLPKLAVSESRRKNHDFTVVAFSFQPALRRRLRDTASAETVLTLPRPVLYFFISSDLLVNGGPYR